MVRNLRPLFVLLFLFAAVPAHAQFTGVEPVTVSISPLYPSPYQTVMVTPGSTVIDLTASIVTVSVNGKVIEKGTGVQNIPVTVGGPGETTKITVSATTGGKTYSKSLSVRPGDVALVVEPVSTTHPFYDGASLIAPQGRVRLIALADLRSAPGTRIPPSSLIYTWKNGEQVLEEQSGIGRSVLTVSAPVRYRGAQISLVVTSPDSSVVAQSSAVISPDDPIVRLYRTDPLLGTLFEHALTGTYTLAGTEESFSAVPYFFAKTPLLAWTVNGQSSGGDKDITVRATGSGAGSATLGLRASDSDTQQSANALLSVLFGNNRPSIFGF